MSKGKSYDSEFEMELILEVLKGRKAFEVANEYNVSCNSIYNWKKEFLNGGLNGLTNDNQIKFQEAAELKEK